MIVRIAAACSLLVFSVSLVCGIMADNTLATTLARGLYAMAGTFVVGLVVGAMAKAIADEQAKAVEIEKKIENSETNPSQQADKRKWAGTARSPDAASPLSRVSERKR